MEPVWPAPAYLRSYCDALERGWSPDNLRPQAAGEERGDDPDAYFRQIVNFEGGDADVKLPDGSVVPRLPGYRKWMWDGDFCGSIQLRWSPTGELPDYCLGHVGYSVVPWKQRRGYATRAVALMLSEARNRGMPHVEITTSPETAHRKR